MVIVLVVHCVNSSALSYVYVVVIVELVYSSIFRRLPTPSY